MAVAPSPSQFSAKLMLLCIGKLKKRINKQSERVDDLS